MAGSIRFISLGSGIVIDKAVCCNGMNDSDLIVVELIMLIMSCSSEIGLNGKDKLLAIFDDSSSESDCVLEMGIIVKLERDVKIRLSGNISRA